MSCSQSFEITSYKKCSEETVLLYILIAESAACKGLDVYTSCKGRVYLYQSCPGYVFSKASVSNIPYTVVSF